MAAAVVPITTPITIPSASIAVLPAGVPPGPPRSSTPPPAVYSASSSVTNGRYSISTACQAAAAAARHR